MSIKLAKKYLQTDKYQYTWNQDLGDGEYAGKIDRDQIDKNEGYEVLHFIQEIMNKHNLTKVWEAHVIEDALHLPELSSVTIRGELNQLVEEVLAL